MDFILLLGRILFGAIFVSSAIGHFKATDAMTAYAESKGVPNARLAVLGGGVVIMVGALSIALGIFGDVGALLLLAFLLPTAFIMHPFWKETDPMMQMNEQVQFMKDVSLAGACLVILWVMSGYPDFTITDNLLDLHDLES